MGQFRHNKGALDSDVRAAEHGNMAAHGVKALQPGQYNEVEQTEDKMPADLTKNMETDKTQDDPSIESPARVSSGSYSGDFMKQPLRYGMVGDQATAKYPQPTRKKEPTLSEKQSTVFDGADGSVKNDKIEGTEVAALSNGGPAKPKPKRVEKLKQKKKDMQKRDSKDQNKSVKKFNKKIQRINTRIERNS